jgi:hypothetical protein
MTANASIPNDVNARLTREAGILAARLAQFLSASLPRVEPSVVEGQAFLQAFFEAVAEGHSLQWWLAHPLEGMPPEAIHPFDRLTQRLSLSPAEIDLMLLAGLSEEHEGLGAVLRTLHPRNEPYPTVGLAAQLICNENFGRDALRKLLGEGVVVKSGALRTTGDVPLFEQSLQLPDALWSALHDIDAWPASVNVINGRIVSAGLEEWFETPGARRAAEAIRRRATCTVAVTGDNDEAAFNRALALVGHAGGTPQGFLFRPAPGVEVDRLIGLHVLARDVVPVLRMAATDGPTTDEGDYFANFPGVIVVCGPSSGICNTGSRPLVNVHLERLLPVARKRMWSSVIPAMGPEAAFLAARYPVEPSVAAEVAEDVNAVAQLENREPTGDDVAASVRARSNISLAAGIRLIAPNASWDDLVLPTDRLEQLHEAVSRLEQQGRVFDEWGFLRERTGARGVRLLFTGPPGTGKTLAAEVLANTLKVDLLVIDLSRVVSKWIGETEKNLAAVFDAAERGKAALFFDEADALFGKRTEVIDAHDRYANLETAYLLTRLEQFEGLAILATNFRQNIDAAFLRRLEFVIDFQEPDREERVALWKCHLPPNAPVATDVNLYELAALYPVVGGVIRNAAVAAGFLAARDGVPIDRLHFVHAIRREYAKAGRSFPGAPIDLVARN